MFVCYIFTMLKFLFFFLCKRKTYQAFDYSVPATIAIMHSSHTIFGILSKMKSFLLDLLHSIFSWWPRIYIFAILHYFFLIICTTFHYRFWKRLWHIRFDVFLDDKIYFISHFLFYYFYLKGLQSDVCSR